MPVDIDELLKDLIKLRISARVGQRELARAMGVTYNKIQRTERGTDKLKKIGVVDCSLWLEACGSSMAKYFGKKASAEERKAVKKDLELLERLQLALDIPDHRRTIESLLDGWDADDERFRKTQQ